MLRSSSNHGPLRLPSDDDDDDETKSHVGGSSGSLPSHLCCILGT